jgi:Gluconate 2-dehydrogenase subunit 3
VSEKSDSSLVEIAPQKKPLRRDLLSRREMSRRLLGVTGAWSLGGLHPVWDHILNGTALLSHPDMDLASENWQPLFLKPEQHEAMQAFSEAVVPGSKQARVSRFIDLLLSVDTSAERQKFLASLSAIQDEAKRRFATTFQKLAPSQCDSLLTAVSRAPESSATRKAFEDLKEWVAGSYYSSEMGMRELGWTPNRFFPGFPGCTHPGEHFS